MWKRARQRQKTLTFLWWSDCDGLGCELLIEVSGVCFRRHLRLEGRDQLRQRGEISLDNIWTCSGCGSHTNEERGDKPSQNKELQGIEVRDVKRKKQKKREKQEGWRRRTDYSEGRKLSTCLTWFRCCHRGPDSHSVVLYKHIHRLTDLQDKRSHPSPLCMFMMCAGWYVLHEFSLTVCYHHFILHHTVIALLDSTNIVLTCS